MIKFLIPMDPVPKGRHRFSRGMVYTPSKTVKAEKLIASEAKRLCGITEPLKGPIKLAAVFQIKRPKSVKREYATARPDLDNYLKTLCDALKDYWLDDSQVVHIECLKRYGPTAFIYVEIDRFKSDPFDHIVYPDGFLVDL